MDKDIARGAPVADDDPRWQALLRRDPAADGQFVYGVRTTGVWGRPSAATRLPRRENVEFFDTPGQAEAAGYRPSRRAAADRGAVEAQWARTVADACRWIESAEQTPSLEALARRAGLSPWHFHRIFKSLTGLTPRAYASAQRARAVRDELESGASVTEALYAAGFGSNGRFYAASDGMLGMTPSDYRAGGRNAVIHFALGECSLGSILVARSERGVCAILLGDDPEALLRDLQDSFPLADLRGGEADFERLVAQVVGFVEAPGLGLALPLDIRGTAFQQRVWQALGEIPPGRTLSYAEVAARIGAPQSVRAVARACGANRLAVAIPCHRVVRSDGGLSGYRWGVERKRLLLAREASGAARPMADAPDGAEVVRPDVPRAGGAAPEAAR